MTEATLSMTVRRIDDTASVIDIEGDITAALGRGPDGRLHRRQRADGSAPSILNFTGLEYMNSGGIGLLVTLLVRAPRQQKLLAVGLTEHYQQIFELTRLDEAIGIYATEADALAAAA